MNWKGVEFFNFPSYEQTVIATARKQIKTIAIHKTVQQMELLDDFVWSRIEQHSDTPSSS